MNWPSILSPLALWLSVAAAATPAVDLPKPWLDDWSAPRPEQRPMQIIHGIADQLANPTTVETLTKSGLGGIVTNVNFSQYLSSDKNWATLRHVLDLCQSAGLVVWIYDEEGYPSLSAGGLVLKANPQVESQVLAYDPSRPDPFFTRPAYEYTHASSNYAAWRRYPNPLEPQATRLFIEKTHEQYCKHLGPHLSTTIPAFFTDEPSLMTCHLGDLKARRVDDPADFENVKILATVPWCADLAMQYQQRFGQDLLPLRKSLFAGDSPADRQVRRNFWSLVAELYADRYFGQLQQWCRGKRVASSGHLLWEESILHHVPLYGNIMKMYLRMDIPGLDMLTSNPQSAVDGRGWLAAALPASGALFNGGRKVMTETSDFSQRNANQGPVPAAAMQATAAWQMALGATEFTSYYQLFPRTPATPSDKYPAPDERCQPWASFIGRVNALLRDAKLAPTTLLYYPSYDLAAEYLPVAARLQLDKQSPRAQRICNSFYAVGNRLMRTQIPFAIADQDLLASGQVRDSALVIRGASFAAIALPEEVELPPAAAAVLEKFAASGGRIYRGANAWTDAPAAEISPLRTANIEPAMEHIVAGRFVRDGRPIVMLVNVGKKDYQGKVQIPGHPQMRTGDWTAANPVSGTMEAVKLIAGTMELNLPSNSTIILVGPRT